MISVIGITEVLLARMVSARTCFSISPKIACETRSRGPSSMLRITGVGVGGYQTSFNDDYYDYKDPKIKANVTISHTSLVTILAELGLIGAVAVTFVAVRWALYLRALMPRADADMKAVLAALAVSSVIIFLGSQTEGRFLEDPYLWLAAGLALAIDAILRDGEHAGPPTT